MAGNGERSDFARHLSQAEQPGGAGRGDAEHLMPGRIEPVTARTGDADA